MVAKHAGECPFCLNTVSPKIVEENYVRRDICECPECRGKILVCRTPGCTRYAKSGKVYDDELCPACTESLSSGTGEVVKWGLMAAAGVVATAAAAKITGNNGS